jgi:hypothetical protein
MHGNMTVSRSRISGGVAPGGQLPPPFSCKNLPSTPSSATAVAVAAAPSVVGAGGVFPVAIDQCRG